MISEYALAMKAKAGLSTISGTIHPYLWSAKIRFGGSFEPVTLLLHVMPRRFRPILQFAIDTRNSTTAFSLFP